MKTTKLVLFAPLLLVLSTSLLMGQTRKIQGFVSDGLERLENVNVQVKNSDVGVKTDTEGLYSIDAETGQTLIYSHLGKKTVEVILEDITQQLNISLIDRVETLDEVTVTRRKRKSQQELFAEYSTNKNLIKTSYGILDKEKSGYAIKVIEGKDLSRAGLDFVDGLQSWIPSAQVFRPSAFRAAASGSLTGLKKQGRPTDLTAPVLYLPRALRSSFSPAPAAYEIDGVVTTVPPTFLRVEDIERVAVVESLAGLGRYGTLGAGGMIIINTKAGNFSPQEASNQKPMDQAVLRDNYFEGKDIILESSLETPIYLEELTKAKNKREARAMFTSMEKKYASSPYFYLDCFTFFTEKMADMDKAKYIRQNLLERFSNDPTILKALAYKLEAQDMHKIAHEVYKDVFRLRPDYAQSYKNLASSYTSLGDFKRSASMHARYNYLLGEALLEQSDDFKMVMDNDFNNLLVLNGSQLSKLDQTLPKNADDFDGVRLVFEWNDGEAEFDIQFVNPDGQYFTWAHSLDANPDRIREEKLIGFSSEEYLIYKPLNGTWKVNIKYLGNKRLTPTYLKTTIYRNFNTPRQTKETMVFKLRAKNVNQQLFALN